MNHTCSNCDHKFQISIERFIVRVDKKPKLRLDKCDICGELKEPEKIHSYRSRRGYDYDCCTNCIEYCSKCKEDYLPCDYYVHEQEWECCTESLQYCSLCVEHYLPEDSIWHEKHEKESYIKKE